MKKIAAVAAALLLGAVGAAQAFEVAETRAEHGMVAAANELAAQAGIEILRSGGNAVDAAVATAMALNVVEFNASGIGGGGYMTIRFAETGETVCLDYREVAPASATKDMYNSEQAKKEKWSLYGGKAVAVPGWASGMEYALRKYGSKTIAEVAAPAIRLAEEGFVLQPAQANIIVDNYEGLLTYNDPEKLAFLEEELPIEAAAILKQPDLARTFRLLAEQGADVFYRGEIGAALVAAVNANGGSMTAEDLADYAMHEVKPVTGQYRGWQIYSMPPSSSGGVHIIQLLNVMENFDLRAFGPNSPKFIHAFAEASKHIFADRASYMADPAFTKLPLVGLCSKDYARSIAAQIGGGVVELVVHGDPWAYEDGEKESLRGGIGGEQMSTSSFSVVDSQGNIVAATNTINHYCGARIVVPGYGFFLNNEMDDFSPDPFSENAPEPGKRPLASMSPTIVLTPEGKPFMSIGSAGGTRIITALAQIIINVIDFSMSMDEAIEQCRFYCESGRKLQIDKDRAEDVPVAELTGLGYEIDPVTPIFFGAAQGVLIDPHTGWLDGGADSRRLGNVVGF